MWLHCALKAVSDSQQKTFLYDFWKEKQVITAISYRFVPCLFFLPQHFWTLSVKGQAQFAMKSKCMCSAVNDSLQPSFKSSWRFNVYNLYQQCFA